MNILLTSIGRRSYLVEYFKKALNNRGEVHVSNSEYTAACCIADGYFISPLIYQDGYIESIIKYCKKHGINNILSVFDIDLLKLSQNKRLLKENGINALISDENIITICNDKWETYKFCKLNKIATPKTYVNPNETLKDIEKNIIEYPIIIKPRWGMGSISIYTANTEEELKVLYSKAKEEIKNTYLKYESSVDFEHSVLIQEFIKGQEYNLDIINDLETNYLLTSVKKKLSMRAGETDIAEVLKNKDLNILGEKIAKQLKHILNLDVDCIKKDDKYHIIDMNCRLGGGFPFSYLCGVNLPAQIIKWLNGEKTDNNLLQVKKHLKVCKTIEPIILKY